MQRIVVSIAIIYIKIQICITGIHFVSVVSPRDLIRPRNGGSYAFDAYRIAFQAELDPLALYFGWAYNNKRENKEFKKMSKRKLRI